MEGVTGLYQSGALSPYKSLTVTDYPYRMVIGLVECHGGRHALGAKTMAYGMFRCSSVTSRVVLGRWPVKAGEDLEKFR